MIEFLVEFFCELVIQILFEIPIGLLDGSLELSERAATVTVKLILYIGMGTAFGYFSYVLLPHTVTGHAPTPLNSFLLIPLCVAGACVSAAQLLESRWNWELGVSRFSYSFVLAVSFAVTRYTMLS